MKPKPAFIILRAPSMYLFEVKPNGVTVWTSDRSQAFKTTEHEAKAMILRWSSGGQPGAFRIIKTT